MNESSHICQSAAVDKRPQHLARFSLFVLPFSLFFWIWALINTLHDGGELDYGLVCFLFSALTSTYMLALGNAKAIPTSKIAKTLATMSMLFVALTYLFAVYLHFAVDSADGIIYYCIVFAALWFGLAYCLHLLMNQKEPDNVGEIARLKERLQSQGRLSVV